MKKTIVCFGDSNTHGYDSETGLRFTETQRYPCLLETYLGSGYLVREEGLSGRTTCMDDPLFEGLNGLTSVHTVLMTHEPVDLFIIMLGTNDTKERFCCNAENIAKGLERLTRKALSTSEAFRDGKPNILIIAPAPIGAGYLNTQVANEMGRGCAEKSRELAPHYERIAGLLGCHFLDAGKIPGISMHPNDHMHLDCNSHALLAAELAGVIPELFQSAPQPFGP